jgi:uncharacterized protein YjbI with pentapeptide repeats
LLATSSISVILLLSLWGKIQLPNDFFAATFLNLIFVPAVAISIFSTLRFFLALGDILFLNSQAFKIVLLLSSAFAAALGSLSSFRVFLNNPDDISSVFLGFLNQTSFGASGGVLFSFTLALCSWLTNHRRKVPWQHPDTLRDWTLAIGSWSGTSFNNLDLSNVNFSGAKLANTDLRARKLYRTNFQRVTSLERARVNNRYLDLEIPKVQKLLTHACSNEVNFNQLTLKGAYLRGADLRRKQFIDSDLTGADLQDADLQNCLLVRTAVIDVNFTGANLTGICIEDWSVNSQTLFTNVQCDYVYRKLDERGDPIDRFPSDRDFEPREFESLYQEVENVVELIFKEGVNWRAVAFTLQKLQLEDEGLGLELRGIEKRGDLWVVRVTHNESISGAEVERRLYPKIEEMQKLLATKEQQINKLLGIAYDQAEALKELSKKPFGNSFLITGSTITNLTGQGQIEYAEAANQVRSIIASAADLSHMTTTAQTLISQLQNHEVAVTLRTQTEFIQQVLLAEAQKDIVFQQFLLQQGQQIISTMSESAIALAIRGAIAQLNSEGSSSII